jgi:hypothetical protein
VVVAHLHAGLRQARAQRLHGGGVREPEGRVGLGGGREVARHADVQLLLAAAEPGAAPGGERRRLGQLGQLQQLAVEAPRLLLAARRRRHLHVVDAQQRGRRAHPP